MSTSTSPAARSNPWLFLAPGLFVVLWASGFAGAKMGLLYSPPLTFLALRFVITAALLALVALASRAAWPSRAQLPHIAAVGLLLHAVYLGSAYLAMALGLEAGTSALIVSVQPLLVAALAGPLLGERVTARQWTGLLLGLAGVALVVWRKAGLDHGGLPAVGLCLVALASITAATLYQKRWLGDMPLLTGATVQFVVAALAAAPVALLLEEPRIDWTAEFVFSLAWLVLVLSIGAIGLLLLLIRRGAASKVSSLFFLVPPTAALMAWPLLGEVLAPLELAGMALVALGVALVNLQR